MIVSKLATLAIVSSYVANDGKHTLRVAADILYR